jgi:hypothetical protein
MSKSLKNKRPNNCDLCVKVNVLSARAMVFTPKKVRVKRVNDNERAMQRAGDTRRWHGTVGIQKASDKG